MGSSTSPQSQSPQSANSATDANRSFTLVGHEEDLRQNLNARVEVRGTIEGASHDATSGIAGSSTAGTSGTSGTGSSVTGTGSSAAGSSTSSSMSATAASQTLHVDSVRKIADSCSGQ
jgi:hypothetical protein